MEGEVTELDRLRKIEGRIDKTIKKARKELLNVYEKCRRCSHAINGRPRSFRGEPCYWHVKGCENMKFVDESKLKSKISLLEYIKNGNDKR